MTLAADIANDAAGFDFIEQVTFTPQQGSVVAGVRALREVLSVSKLQFLGLEPRSVIWNLFVNTLGGAKPTNGDKITDSTGTSFTIKETTLQTLASRFQCLTVQQVS